MSEDTSLRRAFIYLLLLGDVAQHRPWLLLSHITYTRRTNIRKLSVLANIRPSATAENGLSGTVTAPFQRQRSQKV